MHVNNKNISLTVGQTRKTSDIVVAISIPFKGIACCCLNRLKSNCGSPGELMTGSEESALAFALFEAIRDKLAGSPLEILKNRVTNISCASINGNLVISFHTAATGSALRKACGIALSCFNPIKLFAKYSENIKFLSSKGGNREEFNFIAKKLAEGMKKSIHITAVGKINTDMAKLKDIVGVLSNKLADIEIAPAKEITQPAKKSIEAESKPFPIIKCSGLEAAVVADYVRNSSNGMNVAICDTGVIVYNHSWPSKHTQLKEVKRIKDYVSKKYGKLEDKDELSAILAYFGISEGNIDSNISAKLVSTNLKSTSIADLIKKAL